MEVIVTCRHCEIEPELKELIQRRLDHLERFEPRAHRAEVTFTGVKQGVDAEAVVSVDRAERVHAGAEGPDPRTAIDRLVEKLGTQLRRLHDRHHSHRAPPMEELFGPEAPIDDDLVPGAGSEVE